VIEVFVFEEDAQSGQLCPSKGAKTASYETDARNQCSPAILWNEERNNRFHTSYPELLKGSKECFDSVDFAVVGNHRALDNFTRNIHTNNPKGVVIPSREDPVTEEKSCLGY